MKKQPSYPLRRDLGSQLLVVSLAFLALLILVTILFDVFARRWLQEDISAANLALDQAIAQETKAMMDNALQIVRELGRHPAGQPSSVAFATITAFRRGLVFMAGSMLLLGILFWLALSRQVIRPLERLAVFSHEAGLGGENSAEAHRAALARLTERPALMGLLSRSLTRVPQAIEARLNEVLTLLETSAAVASSLVQETVRNRILGQAERLLDVPVSAIFALDEQMAIENSVLFARSDMRLQEQTRRLESLVQSMQDGLLLEDMDGRVVCANRSMAAEEPTKRLSVDRPPRRSRDSRREQDVQESVDFTDIGTCCDFVGVWRKYGTGRHRFSCG